MFDKFGRVEGFGQIAPGRDLPTLEESGQPGRPRKTPLTQAIGAGVPQGMFAGAKTIAALPAMGQDRQPPVKGIATLGASIGAGQMAPAVPPTGPGQLAPSVSQPFVGGTAPAGFDQTKWNDPAKQSPKYLVGRSLAGVQDQLRAIPDEAGRKAFAQQHLQTLIPEIEKQGWKVHEVRNEKMLISGGPNNEPAHWADAVTDIEGAANVGWNVDAPGGAAPQAPISSAQSFIGGAAPTVPGGDFGRLRQQIMQALQVNPQLAALGKTYQ